MKIKIDETGFPWNNIEISEQCLWGKQEKSLKFEMLEEFILMQIGFYFPDVAENITILRWKLSVNQQEKILLHALPLRRDNIIPYPLDFYQVETLLTPVSCPKGGTVEISGKLAVESLVEITVKGFGFGDWTPYQQVTPLQNHPVRKPYSITY